MHSAGIGRWILSVFLAQLLVECISTNNSFAAQHPDLPNVLLLVADDLGYAELGCQGNADVQTPQIDAFAKQSVRYTQGYVTAPNCSPSRAGLLSGRFPTRFGYEFNPIGPRNEDPDTGFPRQQFTLAELLHDTGYTTGLVGKWHLGGAVDFHPQRHGFDEFFGFLHEGHYFVPSPWNNTTTWIRRKGLPPGSDGRYQVNEHLVYSSHMGHDEPAYDANNPVLRGGQPVIEEAYFTDAITREATSFIRRYHDDPWFLCVAYNAVHSPLQAKNETLTKFAEEKDIQRRIFLAMLYDLDKSVGEILETLREVKQDKNTLVMFISDNGGPTKETTASNLPLRDGKGSMYEGGIRVPFLVRWPGKLKGGTTSDAVVSSVDLYATLTSYLGQTPKQSLDGINLLKNEPSADRTLYWRQGKRAALRQGRWKIVAPNGYAQRDDWELYDLAEDPGESNNLADLPNYSERFNELIMKWQATNDEMREPLFGR